MGHNTVYITAEMAPAKVIRRIGANLLDIPMFDYAKKSADRQFIKRKLEKVSNGLLPPGKLFVKEFPTSQASVVDVETYWKVDINDEWTELDSYQFIAVNGYNNYQGGYNQSIESDLVYLTNPDVNI
jgi:hypothetical protein